MSSSFRLELDKWLSGLDVKADRVLDIGGSQLNVKGRTKSWDVKEYLIADLPEPHIGSPKPDLEIDLNKDAERNLWVGNKGRKYDLIFCLEVFDYVYDPIVAFDHIYHLLASGGTAWISFPSIYPLHQPVEDDALRYMPGGIKKLADSVGLKIEEMIPRRFETDLWEKTYRAERMRAAKHEDHNFSGWVVRLSK